MPTLWCGSTDEAVCPQLQRTGVLFLLLAVRSRLLLKGFIMMGTQLHIPAGQVALLCRQQLPRCWLCAAASSARLQSMVTPGSAAMRAADPLNHSSARLRGVNRRGAKRPRRSQEGNRCCKALQLQQVTSGPSRCGLVVSVFCVCLVFNQLLS